MATEFTVVIRKKESLMILWKQSSNLCSSALPPPTHLKKQNLGGCAQATGPTELRFRFMTVLVPRLLESEVD